MKNLIIEINSNTDSDIVFALEAIIKELSEGYISAFDENDESNYQFNLSEIEED